MILSDDLRGSLVQVAQAMAPARHDWWIIASAAVALHGEDPGVVRDVDVLLDQRDVAAVFEPLGLGVAAGQETGLFRSAVFATWHGPALPVELFARFQLYQAGRWTPIHLETREAVAVEGAMLYVPSRPELADLLRRFGRPKDLARAELLSPSGRSPSRSGNA